MKTLRLCTLLLSMVIFLGCSGKFWGGTATGVIGAGAGYEFNANREMKRIDQALKDGTMNQEEYDIRKDQIRRMSVIE